MYAFLRLYLGRAAQKVSSSLGCFILMAAIT